jgi:hypothetical protein
MKVVYVNHSLGNNFGDSIELNKHLKKYPNLHDSILKHESEHTNSFFSWRDFKLDITESRTNQKDLIMFMLKHPLSFVQFIPFYWTRKHGFVYDLNLIFIYLFISMFVWLTFFVLR